ncbi:MAG: 2-oxo acid dehydrogenase subunit E2 [Acholeplasmatales bacterium]|nr:MAG: 2-oxo acid dehydrogenase subunit E2 [Acholeplasmatales bacterium]
MIDFKFADIGEGIHEGVILKWFFEVGDKVEEGETLCIVETDKVNAEIPAPEGGILKKRGAEVGETIHVGETLALIEDGDDSASATPATTEKETVSEPEEEKAEPKPVKGDDAASVVGAIEISDEVLAASSEHEDNQEDKAESVKVLATPVARKLASDLHVDLSQIKGSGPHGRILKADIHAAAESKKTETAPTPSTPTTTYGMPKFDTSRVRREKITKLRKAIVDAMNTSNTLIPATTVMDEFDVTDLVTFRNAQKERSEVLDVKLTYLPLIIKAVVLTLKQYPVFNASFDHTTDEIIFKDYINIGIAVDTPDGLIVPNIKDADKKSILELAREIDTLAQAARERKVQLAALQHTTFSITNYGAFGSKLGTPVIKHPEVAILGMGSITKKPVVIDDAIVIRDMFPVSLTIDHRIIDGGDAGRFMVQLKAYLSDPITLLLS